MRVPGAPYAIDKVIDREERSRLGHDRQGLSQRPLLFQQAAAVFHAHGGRVLGDLPRDGQVAGHAPLRNRPLHAGHDQRGLPAADLHFHRPARRAAGHDRLGTDPGHGVLRLWHVSHHVRDRRSPTICLPRPARQCCWTPWCGSGSTATAAPAGLDVHRRRLLQRDVGGQRDSGRAALGAGHAGRSLRCAEEDAARLCAALPCW